MSRAEKIAARAATRRRFLAQRPLVCSECGVRFINDEMAQVMRDTGITDCLCDDCSWNHAGAGGEP